MQLTKTGLFDFARRHRGEFENLLADFVAVPTVSADPAHRGDIERGADLAYGASAGTFVSTALPAATPSSTPSSATTPRVPP